jgi:hypothetical protein
VVGVGQLALGPLPWEFWIATCAYRCCCSANAVAAALAVGEASAAEQAADDAARRRTTLVAPITAGACFAGEIEEGEKK